MSRTGQRRASAPTNIPAQLRKISLISAVGVLVVGLVGFLATATTRAKMISIEHLAEVQANSYLADMAHDAVHADVLSARLAPTEADAAAAREALEENLGILKEKVVGNEALLVSAEVEAAVEAATPAIEAYDKSARAIVSGKLTGDALEAEISKFDANFETLKEDLEGLSTAVDDYSKSATARAERSASLALGAIVVLCLGALAVVWTTAKKAATRITKPLAAFADFLAPTSDELNEVSQSVGAAAEETAVQAQTVSSASAEVTQSVQAVASVVEELNASIREISTHAQDAATIAARAVSVSNSASEVVDRLASSSTEIGKVVELISSIAEETSLLALNATIEAARAGDSGKGFAVVASEVKGLAQGSAEATEGIRTKIEAIRADAAAAAVALGDIAQIIDQINDISGTIASAVEEQTAATAEMASNVMQVSQGAASITDNISEVASASVATSQSVMSTTSSAERLRTMAAELGSLIGR